MAALTAPQRRYLEILHAEGWGPANATIGSRNRKPLWGRLIDAGLVEWETRTFRTPSGNKVRYQALILTEAGRKAISR